MVAVLRRAFERFATDALAARQDSEAIIFSTIAVMGYSAAEKMRVLSLWAPLQPMSRTREFPSLFMPKPFAKSLNRFSHAAEEQMVWQPFRQFINRWRHEALGLKPFPFGRPYAMLNRTRFPILYGCSPAVLPKPAD